MQPLLVGIFHEDADKRAKAVRALAVAHPPGADEFLAHLVGSQDPTTSLAAMEVLWDSPPFNAGVEALYRKAFPMPNATAPSVSVPLKFRGEPVPAAPAVPSFGQCNPESTIACHVLSHLNPPQLPTLLHGFFQTAKTVLDQGPTANPQYFSFTGTGDLMHNACSLAVVTESRMLIPDIYQLATRRLTEEGTSQSRLGILYTSNRTESLGAWVVLTHQTPGEYHLMHTGSGRWAFASKEAETAAEEKMTAWNADHIVTAPEK